MVGDDRHEGTTGEPIESRIGVELIRTMGTSPGFA
jgi:hypothetical protein